MIVAHLGWSCYHFPMSAFPTTLDILNRSQAPYVIVGGLAVNLHGYQRFTSDLDIVIDLQPRAAQLIVQALFDGGFKPRVPVTAADFADPAKVQEWRELKGAKVIQFLNPKFPTFSVDVFVDPPLPFSDLFQESKVIPLGTTSGRVCSLSHLIQMKRKAGREQDLLDLKILEKIAKAESSL